MRVAPQSGAFEHTNAQTDLDRLMLEPALCLDLLLLWSSI